MRAGLTTGQLSSPTLRTTGTVWQRPIAAAGAAFLLMTGAGLAIVGVVLFGLIYLSMQPPAQPDTPLEVPVGVASASVVTVTSDPAGAEVLRDDVLLGKTPYEVEISADVEWTLTVSLAGYEPRKVLVDGKQAEIGVDLKEKPAAAPAPVPEPAQPVGAAEEPKPKPTRPKPKPPPQQPRPQPAPDSMIKIKR